MEEYRLIKRYPNRKFYDTWNSTYVTLEDISNMIKRGYDVKVIDNKTGEDITPIILSQVFFEEGKRRKATLPISVLKRLIIGGEESISQFFAKLAQTSFQSLKDASDKISEGTDDGVALVKELLVSTQGMIDDFQKRIDQKTREFLDRLALAPSQAKQVEELQAKVVELEKKISELEKKLEEKSKKTERKKKKSTSTRRK